MKKNIKSFWMLSAISDRNRYFLFPEKVHLCYGFRKQDYYLTTLLNLVSDSRVKINWKAGESVWQCCKDMVRLYNSFSTVWYIQIETFRFYSFGWKLFSYNRREIKRCLAHALQYVGSTPPRIWTQYWAFHQRFFKQLWLVLLFLTHFWPVFPFLVFSVGIKRRHWIEIG